MAISTKTLSLLPDIPTLRNLSQSLALLDAILSPHWEHRYYSFNSQWSPQQAFASMRDGGGDNYMAWFSPAGVVLKGFTHESPMSPYRMNPPQIWLGMFDRLPPQFGSFLSDPAFNLEETTFCIWRIWAADWQIGDVQFPDGRDPDGSACLLKLLDGKPQSYHQWAQGYYERSVDLSAVIHIYEHQPLTEDTLTALNADLSISDLAFDLTEIGYSPLNPR